jgi:hypothetical protein
MRDEPERLRQGVSSSGERWRTPEDAHLGSANAQRRLLCLSMKTAGRSSQAAPQATGDAKQFLRPVTGEQEPHDDTHQRVYRRCNFPHIRSISADSFLSLLHLFHDQIHFTLG